MLSLDDVTRIASLARISISEDEKEELRNDLESILGFVGKLNEVDTTGIEPTAHVTGVVNILRKDEAEPGKPKAENGNPLLRQAPQSEGKHVKVKAVFD